MPAYSPIEYDDALDEAERRFEEQVEAGAPGDWHANLRLIFQLETARREPVPRYLEFVVPQ